jgi:hypothetical protein
MSGGRLSCRPSAFLFVQLPLAHKQNLSQAHPSRDQLLIESHFPGFWLTPFLLRAFRSFKKQEDDFRVTISYDPSELLPPSLTSHEVAAYEVRGVANATQKYQANATAPLKVCPLPEQEGRLPG